MSENVFNYMMRRDTDEVSVKGAMDVIQDIKTMIVQYNKWAVKNLFPEISLDCYLNTDGKLVTKLDVGIHNNTLQLRQGLEASKKEAFDMYYKLEAKYKELENKYKTLQENWMLDAANRKNEWDMIKSLTKTPDYNKALDFKALEEQIYHDLRKKYGLEE
jgi:hypothetical protein